MNTPNLNRALVLETPELLSDGAGGYNQVWSPLGTLWAEITARSGRETTQSDAAVSRASFRIVVRGAPWGNPERPKPHQRFRDGARVYAIQAVAERDTGGRYLTCFVAEEVAV